MLSFYVDLHLANTLIIEMLVSQTPEQVRIDHSHLELSWSNNSPHKAVFSANNINLFAVVLLI